MSQTAIATPVQPANEAQLKAQRLAAKLTRTRAQRMLHISALIRSVVDLDKEHKAILADCTEAVRAQVKEQTEQQDAELCDVLTQCRPD